MKKTVLIAFSLLALAATAQSQTTMRQAISNKVHNVHTENLTKVVIVSDTTNYVLITPTQNAMSDEVPSGLLSVKGYTLTFEDMAALYNIELHLASQSLSIYAEEMSEVTLRYKSDTLNMRNLKVHTEDLATVTIEPFVVANRVDFYSEDLSTINHNGSTPTAAPNTTTARTYRTTTLKATATYRPSTNPTPTRPTTPAKAATPTAGPTTPPPAPAKPKNAANTTTLATAPASSSSGAGTTGATA